MTFVKSSIYGRLSCVTIQVCNFVNKGLDERDICVLATYSKQVKTIREVLRKNKKLEVYNVII